MKSSLRNSAGRRVAKDIIKKIKRGERVNITQIHRDNGYSEKSSNVQIAVDSKGFKDVIIENKKFLKPFADQLGEKGQRLLDALTGEKISDATGRDIMYMFDLAHKNKLLAEGRATENIAIHAKIEITTKDQAEKYLQEYFSNNV